MKIENIFNNDLKKYLEYLLKCKIIAGSKYISDLTNSKYFFIKLNKNIRLKISCHLFSYFSKIEVCIFLEVIKNLKDKQKEILLTKFDIKINDFKVETVFDNDLLPLEVKTHSAIYNYKISDYEYNITNLYDLIISNLKNHNVIKNLTVLKHRNLEGKIKDAEYYDFQNNNCFNNYYCLECRLFVLDFHKKLLNDFYEIYKNENMTDNNLILQKLKNSYNEKLKRYDIPIQHYQNITTILNNLLKKSNLRVELVPDDIYLKIKLNNI